MDQHQNRVSPRGALRIGGAQAGALTAVVMLALSVVLAVGESPVSADPAVGDVTVFADPGVPFVTGVTVGPDNAIWYTTGGDRDTVGRLELDGTVTVFADPLIDSSYGIVTGSDGALWFANSAGNSIGRITPSGTVSKFTHSGLDRPREVVLGGDGNVWFTNAYHVSAKRSIGRITPTGEITLFGGLGAYPRQLTAGPDGAIWFLTDEPRRLGRISTSGQLTMSADDFWVGGSQIGITAGPDGNLWIAQDTGSVLRVTPQWAKTEFTVPGSDRKLSRVAVGPDGNLWFSDRWYAQEVVRMTPAGEATTFPIPDGGATNTPNPIVAGPDGAMWLRSYVNGQFVMLRMQAAVGPPGAPGVPVGVAGDGSVSVSWTPPVMSGGGAVSGYVVTASPGGATCSTTGATSCVVSGLANGTPYTFTVVASNAYGAGPASGASAPVTPVAPVVTSVSPKAGIAAGGASVTIRGWGFDGASQVRFGPTNATSFEVIDDTTIVAVSPPRPVGLVNVFVHAPDGVSPAGQPAWFNYLANPSSPPTVSLTSPNSGPIAGGTTVTLTGTGFLSTSAVRFGPSTPAASFEVLSDTQLRVVTPAMPASLANIWVTNHAGTSSSSASSWFWFKIVTGPPPEITAMAPNRGPAAGGTTVTITGTGFTGATQVRFASSNATSFTVVSDTHIEAVSPARPVGYVNVFVTTANGTSATGSQTLYAFTSS